MLGDCAAIPGPDGKPYPNLVQHALREAKVLAGNIAGALDGRPPQPFVYSTLGMMGSLGHGKAFAQMLKVRLHGFPAWFVRHVLPASNAGLGPPTAHHDRLDIRPPVSTGRGQDQPRQRGRAAPPRSAGRRGRGESDL